MANAKKMSDGVWLYPAGIHWCGSCNPHEMHNYMVADFYDQPVCLGVGGIAGVSGLLQERSTLYDRISKIDTLLRDMGQASHDFRQSLLA